jgi:hypothetical protein
MSVYVCNSTDTGAPTLSGTAGDLTTLLDALLVNGYNSKTITITRSGATATATCTNHGFNTKQTVLISGADQAEYNGEFKVLTTADANTFTFAVSGSPATPATGTITCVVAPLGWSIAYTATDKRAYRQKVGTNQFYLRVVDDGTGSASYARAVGYETMSDIDTGTGAFPTNVQVSGGGYCHKSSAASGTTRGWRFFSDGEGFHLMVKIDGTWYTRVLGFGDFTPYSASDTFNTYIDVSNNSLYSSATTPLDHAGSNQGWATTTGTTYAWAARSYSGTGTAVQLGGGSATNLGNATATNPYPHPIYGGLLMARVLINESGAGVRGYVRGVWATTHNLYSAYVSEGDTWSGAVGTSQEGKTFTVVKQFWHGLASVYETSDTWGDP